MKSYAEKLKDPRWQKKRLKTLERDSWRCRHCGDGKTMLHVHHDKYNGNPWEAPDEDLITLCENCHTDVHECTEDTKEIIDIINIYIELFNLPYLLWVQKFCETLIVYKRIPENIKDILNEVV